MATPALHAETGRLFVGLGGYDGIGDGTRTPFIRSLDWATLADRWPGVVGPDGVFRYTDATPPLVAWGLRNAYGLGFLPDGTLLATDQGARKLSSPSASPSKMRVASARAQKAG